MGVGLGSPSLAAVRAPGGTQQLVHMGGRHAQRPPHLGFQLRVQRTCLRQPRAQQSRDSGAAGSQDPLGGQEPDGRQLGLQQQRGASGR